MKTIDEDRNAPEYLYWIYTWGGFYNPDHVKNHGRSKSGLMYFEDKEDRDTYRDVLLECEQNYKAFHLCYLEGEGYDVKILPVMHRVVEYDGKRYYQKNKWFWPEREISGLLHCMEWKWPLEIDGEDNADETNIKIIQEWITGGFSY